MTWVWVCFVIVALFVVITNHRINQLEDKIKVLEQDKATKEKWLLWLLNRRSSNDKERPESVHSGEEGR